MSENPTVIYGSGGHGKVILDILRSLDQRVDGFLDDNQEQWGKEINGIKVLGGKNYLDEQKDAGVVIGIGDNITREKIQNLVKEMGIKIVCAIHPQAVISSYVTIGSGVVVMPGAVVSTNSVLEEGVVVNTGASVDHDCVIKSYAQVWPGSHIAGNVEIGRCTYIGTGASIIQNINVGDHSIVGAGAAVIDHVPDHTVAVGVPARLIPKKDK